MRHSLQKIDSTIANKELASDEGRKDSGRPE
jgi:hypothetical protein